MPWTQVRPVIADLLVVQARVERLRLVDKLRAAEVHMQAAGLDTSELVAARKQLMNERISQDGPMFLGAPLPRPPPVQTDGTQRLRHLLITEPSRV